MINCTITSSKKTVVYKNVCSVTLPAFLGQMQVLFNHAESFVLLQSGNILLDQEKKQHKTIPVNNGECYIKNNKVIVVL